METMRRPLRRAGLEMPSWRMAMVPGGEIFCYEAGDVAGGGAWVDG
jgi:hypothetical protein